jgi:hypothetical protein
MAASVEQNIVIMAACIPTMRPFFNRAWKRGLTSDKSRSASRDQFASVSIGRSRIAHRRVGSSTDVALDDIYNKDDAASQESQQGIVRTVEVSMDWNPQPESLPRRTKDTIVPRAIADSERR